MQISLIFSTAPVITSGVGGREVDSILNTFSLPIKIGSGFTKKKKKIDTIRGQMINIITHRLATMTILSSPAFQQPVKRVSFRYFKIFDNIIVISTTILDKFEEFWSNENYAQLMPRPTPFPPNHFSTYTLVKKTSTTVIFNNICQLISSQPAIFRIETAAKNSSDFDGDLQQEEIQHREANHIRIQSQSIERGAVPQRAHYNNDYAYSLRQ
jgi:hypothetical protein